MIPVKTTIERDGEGAVGRKAKEKAWSLRSKNQE